MEDARREGLDATGPLPNDTLFYHALAGDYDAVVAMYHDQGHIALKTVGFQRAVNVTLGLPIVRTSVAHGTAFDIAWKGLADASSLIAAVRVAARIVAGRPAAQRRMISASTQFVSIAPGQTERISGSAQPSWASAARCSRNAPGAGRSITPCGSGPIGSESNRRIVDAEASPPRGEQALAAHDQRAGREATRRALEFERDRVGQVARQGRVHRQPRRIPQDPLAPERHEPGRPFVRACGRLQPDGPRHRLVPGRVGEGQDRVEAQDRVEIELERDVRQLESPRRRRGPRSGRVLWSTRRCGPLVGKSSGTIENATSAAAGLPRRELLQRGAAGADDPVGPFQVLGTRRGPGHRAGRGRRTWPTMGISACRRARIAAAGAPGHGEAAADDRLLLLGDELVVAPEAGQAHARRPCAAARIRSC